MSSSSSGLQLEQLKLLSTAEKLGLFSLAERVLTTDPGAISSASIPFFLAAVGDTLQMLAALTVNPGIRYQLSRQLRLRQLALESSMARFKLQASAVTADIGTSAQARWCSSPRTPCCSRSRTGRPSPHASRASPRCLSAALWWRQCRRSDMGSVDSHRHACNTAACPSCYALHIAEQLLGTHSGQQCFGIGNR
jgi:Protein of unknown function (DUF1118)